MDAGITIGANVVSALIGRQILSQAISDASGTIYSSLGDIFYYSADVDKVLSELDIADKLLTMELLIKELNSHSDCFDEQSTKLFREFTRYDNAYTRGFKTDKRTNRET